MTEYTPEKVAELIADARAMGASAIVRGAPTTSATLIHHLADALEATEDARAMTLMFMHHARAERDTAIAVGERIMADALKVGAERDEALAVITEAKAMHRPKKIWESDRAYTLVCTHCELHPYPCATARILSRIHEHPKED